MGRSTVRSRVQETEAEVLAWLHRSVPEAIRDLMLDGMFVSRKRTTTRSEFAMTVIGGTHSGARYVIVILAAPSESIASWTACLQQLKHRGRNIKKLRMAISDGCISFIKVLEHKLPSVLRQRRTVHGTHNVLYVAAPAVKSAATKHAAAMWNALNKSEARQRAAAFETAWAPYHPHLAALIRDDSKATLTFYDLHSTTCKSLRSASAFERFSREMRRTFRNTGACKSDASVTRIAGRVAMRLAKNWDGVAKQRRKTAARKKHAS